MKPYYFLLVFLLVRVSRGARSQEGLLQLSAAQPEGLAAGTLVQSPGP